MKLDILAIGAHPDDVELSCAGTIAKEIDRGKKVGILDLTRGEMGTRGTAQTRADEAAEAGKILGIEMRHNLGLADAQFENNFENHKQEAWRPKLVYHYIQWKNLTPEIVVDITGYMDIKLASVKAYKTQVFDKNSTEPKTPISDDNFLDSITYRARDLGRLIGTDHAEGYTVERYPAVDSTFDLI